MRIHTFKLWFGIFCCVAFLYNEAISADDPCRAVRDPVMNFITLENIYSKWHMGRFGSRKVHESCLREFLSSLIDNEIVTDYDYMPVSPEGIYDKRVEARTTLKWLEIKGRLDEESVKKVFGSDPMLLKRWWRSGIFIAVKGKVKWYRITRNVYGDAVELYLDTVTVVYDNNVLKKK